MISKDKNTIAILLHETAHQLRTLIDGKVGPFDLTRLKWLALAILDREDGVSQATLASHLDIEPSSVGRLVERMEKRGLVRRERDQRDRRIVRVYINDQARPLLEDLEKVSDDVRKIAVSGLSVTDQKHLVRLLGKIKDNLKSS